MHLGLALVTLASTCACTHTHTPGGRASSPTCTHTHTHAPGGRASSPAAPCQAPPAQTYTHTHTHTYSVYVHKHTIHSGCMCACMYVYMYVCTYICMYVRTCVCMYACRLLLTLLVVTAMYATAASPTPHLHPHTPSLPYPPLCMYVLRAPPSHYRYIPPPMPPLTHAQGYKPPTTHRFALAAIPLHIYVTLYTHMSPAAYC